MKTADTHEQQSERGKSLNAASQNIMAQHLWVKILIGLVLGVILGLLISPSGFFLLDEQTADMVGEWLALPGRIFLGLIQMVIIPLVVCSIIVGIADSGSLEFVRRMGLRIIPYFVVTTAIAVSIGLFLVNLIRPGDFVDQHLVDMALQSGAADARLPGKTFEDLTIPQRIANLIPTNLAQAQVDKNMLQIVIASILAGIALLSMSDEASKPLRDLCVSGQILTMKIISWAMHIAPYAVFGLISNITIRIGISALISVGLYMVTVLLGLACMLVVYTVLVKLLAHLKPSHFFTGIREVQLLAFSTSSSAATMPFSIHAAEENLGIMPEITRFVIPLGATVNMDGTALYQAVAAVFLCQVFGVELSHGATLLLLMTTIGASIGTPATPGVGIVVLATILTGIGIQPEGIALIIGVDRILDMCRTTVNVTGDLTASAVMQRWVGNSLLPVERVQAEDHKAEETKAA